MNQQFKILGINESASLRQIKKAYYKLAKKYHPDVNKEQGAREQFIKINEAYEILTDPDYKSKLARKFRSRKRKTRQTTPSERTKERAKRKAHQKAKMSSEEFKAYRLKQFSADKRKLIQMFAASIGMVLFIVWVISVNNIPGAKGYKEGLEQSVGIFLLFPVSIFLLIIGVSYRSVTQDEKFFREKSS
ncbi:MAG: DnaJ domain-containing protein [Flavobacteriales bacterium]|nr:DnaJ domain-containing protein [Flavobacteriales bacterium]